MGDTNYTVAPNTTLATSLSDDAVMPFYIGMPIEGNPGDNVLGGNADQHSLTLTQDGVDYESWRMVYCSKCTPDFRADQATIWDLTQDEKRPYTMTSADAAGLPILPFLYRYDEVLAGGFNHAFRFTENWFGGEYNTGHGYGTFAGPAVHSSCTGMSQNYMGMRMRLKSSFTSSACSSPINQMFLAAMKKYGGIAADRGRRTIAGRTMRVWRAWPPWTSRTSRSSRIRAQRSMPWTAIPRAWHRWSTALVHR